MRLQSRCERSLIGCPPPRYLTHPARKPIPIALVELSVTASPKKTMPLKARGSLLRAPTMLYVVLDVARMHQAVV